MYRALYLDKLLEDNEELYEDRDRVIAHMAHQFRAIEDTDYEVPKSLKKIMRNYQKEGFKWLKTLESWGFGGILADEMGLGKTLQAISLLLSAKEEGRTGPSLIVCPASLVYNWEEEIHRFAPALHVRTVTGTQEERKAILTEEGCDVLVTSYDLLKRDIGQYENREFDIEIIDEAQYIKNHSTAAAKSVKVIKSRIRFALTGTPVENRLSELWSIFDYLMPGFLYGYETFRKEYEIPIVKNEDQESMQRLQRLTGPFILRRRKEDVLKDLPEKLEEVRYVRLEEKQQRIYDGQVVQIRQTLNNQSEAEFSQNKLQILAALTRLRQICCDPSLCLENYDGETAKTDACMELIQGAIEGGHRMLVFSQFTSMLDILKERLQKEGIDFFVLTGSTSKEERRELVRKFNEGTVPVFLISLKAGGVGLNLTGADLVIHYDPWWNLAAQNQATDRAHRIGQTKKVTVYKLIAKDTIEEKILKLQEKKRELADQILNGEGTSISTLNREEILDILEGSK
jgi:SNF2 family DNA or RNA helicase